MADDVQPRIVLDGDVSPLRQKFREASADLKKFGSDGEASLGRMTGPLAKLQSSFVAFAALLAGGAVFKEAVKQAADFTEQSMKLGQALGISATQASTFITALEDIDVSQEAFLIATKAMSKELKINEDVLQSMGLKTRDAAGHLRPLNELTVEGIEILNGYKAGTDRAIAGQAMFGKGFELTGNLLKLNSATLKENAELQQRLGVIVGAENVAAWEAFDSAGDKSTLTMKALGNSIGNALIPVLTVLGEWFVAVGPAAVTVIKGAIGGLVSVFWGLKLSAEIVWNVIALAIEKTTIQAVRFSDVFIKALQFDFKGAKAAWEIGGEMLEDVTTKRLGNIVKAAEDAQQKLWNLFADGTPSAAPSSEGKSAVGLLTPAAKTPEKTKKEPVDPSFMATYDARLAAIKNLYEQENVLREFSKEQELAYWRELQQNLQLTSKDAVTIAKRTATLELEIRRELARDLRALDAVMLDGKRSAALAQIELEQQSAGFARENGEITKMQLLEQEEQFARRRFEIEYQSLLERQELLKNDPNTTPAALAQNKEQMLQIERQYLLRKRQLGQDKKEEGDSGMFGDVGSSFATAARQILTTATTLRQQLGNIFQSIFSSFVTNLITKPLSDFVASKAKMLAVEMGFLQAETGAKQATAVVSKAITGDQAMVEVGNKGASAAAGAADSVASIPYIGPILAAAAFAATLGMVLGARSNVKSAALGFDIPHGLNPMTQLHEEEMVLPKIHANTIRRLGEQGGEGGAAQTTVINNNFNSTYQDRAGIKRLFIDNPEFMTMGLKRAQRNRSGGI